MKRVSVQGAAYYRIERANIKAELQQLLPAGNPSCITQHWTAGNYTTGYRDYQILVGKDHLLVSANLLNWNGHQHTWRRNNGNLGLSFMAMANATERNPGHFPITPAMLEMAALAVGMLMKRYGIAPGQVVDHRYWAERDGYAHLRWDCRWLLPAEFKCEPGETVTDAVLRKAKWYKSKL